MFKTILFDLDGTLLPMDQDEYIQYYTDALSRHYEKKGMDRDLFNQSMYHAIVKAMTHTDERTNEEVFWDVFTAESGMDMRTDYEYLLQFYAEIHPTLTAAVRQGRNSRMPVDLLKAKGYQTVLATNPLFPRMCTYQRMSWVGLRPSDFEMVTTYEDSTRCKPSPEYFAELVKKLGLNPEECLMVGNDTRDDMAAEAIGMKVYIITDFLINRDEKELPPGLHGTFEDFVKFAQELPDQNQ